MNDLPYAFSWIRENEVAGLGLPSPEDLPRLGALGIRALLTLTARPPVGDPAAFDIASRHEPVVDFEPPTQSQLVSCVAWIEGHRRAGRAVGVHCMAGRGRTGTMLAAWLVSQGLGANEAIAEVRRLRPGSIETVAQEDAVRAFEETWRDARD